MPGWDSMYASSVWHICMGEAPQSGLRRGEKPQGALADRVRRSSCLMTRGLKNSLVQMILYKLNVNRRNGLKAGNQYNELNPRQFCQWVVYRQQLLVAICAWRVSNESGTLSWNASISCEKQWKKKKQKLAALLSEWRLAETLETERLCVEMKKERRWEEKDTDRKKGKLQLHPPVSLHSRSLTWNKGVLLKPVRNAGRGKDGAEEKGKSTVNCKHTPAVRRA